MDIPKDSSLFSNTSYRTITAVKHLELDQFFQLDKSFWGVVSAAVEQSRHKPKWFLWETGNSALEADPRIPAFGPHRILDSSTGCALLTDPTVN